MTDNATTRRDEQRSDSRSTEATSSGSARKTVTESAGESVSDSTLRTDPDRNDLLGPEPGISRVSGSNVAAGPESNDPGAPKSNGQLDRESPVERELPSALRSESAAFRRWCTETGAVLADADRARIDVHVRSMLPPPGAKDAQVDLLNDLSALEGESSIRTVTVDVWGERLCLCDRCRETETGRKFLQTVHRFEQWGGEYDASPSPFFERTRQNSSLVGDAHEGIAPPRITAALYVDDSLQGVFPARFDEECYSVHDFSRAVAELVDGERVYEPLESTR